LDTIVPVEISAALVPLELFQKLISYRNENTCLYRPWFSTGNMATNYTKYG